MEDIFERLSLKEEFFKTFKVASDKDFVELWESILEIDNTLDYKEFSEVYGTITTEQHRFSSKQQQKKTSKQHGIPNVQFAKNESETFEGDNSNNYESEDVSKLFEKR
ncbi:10874_t:CDS:2 [Funneliformis geosporum]|uniref:10874_t:CDS:1 n=1 Tax=Funneliformis geosporum TaxID=1117311 RepID=A0A9W4SL19_9GLOM|nr:10874_t:CDS:2 [Funneliformis geosporum]